MVNIKQITGVQSLLGRIDELEHKMEEQSKKILEIEDCLKKITNDTQEK